MKINRQGIVYTVVYAVVLVLVVAAGLSLVYQMLRPEQVENMANDKRKQILASIRVVPADNSEIPQLYEKYIRESFNVNSRGEKVPGGVDAFDVNVAEQVRKSREERTLPVFVAQTDNGTKYILPVYGAGLWGPIWGYVSFDDNGDTIYGAYFSHQGETPGLGAEIEKPDFSDQFEGKNIFADGGFESIQVVKRGGEPTKGDYVYGISGGTITSKGVQTMLSNSLDPYSSFLINLREKPQAETPIKQN